MRMHEAQNHPLVTPRPGWRAAADDGRASYIWRFFRIIMSTTKPATTIMPTV